MSSFAQNPSSDASQTTARFHTPLKYYLIAVASVAIASVSTMLMTPVLRGTVTPLFFGAVMISAWVGGFWPGMLATVLSLVALDRAIDPNAVFGEVEQVGLVSFAVVSFVICALNSSRKVAQTELLLHRNELENRVEERTRQLAALNVSLQQEALERHKAEQTLRESEENFRNLFEDAPVAYHEIDKKGIIRRVNRAECRLLGYSPAELIGKPVWELVTPAQREQSRKDVLAKIEEKHPIAPLERTYACSNQEQVFVEIHENLIRNNEGEVIGVRSSLLDITERFRIEEAARNLTASLEKRVAERTLELQRSNEALQEFAYSASHDLQEPLRMVASYTRLIQNRYQDRLDSDGREFLHYVVDGAERMTQMIRDLLVFSRAGGDDEENLEEIRVEEILETAVANLKWMIEESEAAIFWDALPVVYGRRAGLAQVVQNLLSNSLKYKSAEKPVIHISAARKNSHWVLCFQDNGLGFDQKFAGSVFGLFKRLLGKQYPGTGMGLAICKRIIERNGGTIWAESESGRGAKFYFSLPTHNSR